MSKSRKVKFGITNSTKNSIPHKGMIYEQIKNAVLGKNYALSLVFIGERRSKTLNKTYRGKNKATDILSFPLSKYEGEIFINQNRTKIEAKKFSRPYENFLLFLFIHGLCHLKGMAHSSRMENEERKYRKMFQV